MNKSRPLYVFSSKHPGISKPLLHCFTSKQEAKQWRNNWVVVDGRKCSKVVRCFIFGQV